MENHPRVAITTECAEWVAIIGKASRKRQALHLSLDREGRLQDSRAGNTDQLIGGQPRQAPKGR